MNRKPFLILLTLFVSLCLSAGTCSADEALGGIPLTEVHEGVVTGGVYFDSYYGIADQVKGQPITISKTFTLPDDAEIDWAMLFTSVYCGSQDANYRGTANVSFGGTVLGNETLNVPFVFKMNGGDGFVLVNSHTNRVTSDYVMNYNVTDLVQPGENTAVINTAPIDSTFDGRIKLMSLVVAYNNSSDRTTWYQVNLGHDVDSYYSENSLGVDYIGSTDFDAQLPEGSLPKGANLTAVYMASANGAYAFNEGELVSSTPQGYYGGGSDTWDVTDSLNPAGTNTMTYNRSSSYYKIVLGTLTAEYEEETSGNEDADLNLTELAVFHNSYAGAWKDLNNTVSVTVRNEGPEAVSGTPVVLFEDGVEVGNETIETLPSGVDTVVSFTWKPGEEKTYSLKAVADPYNVISDPDRTNNEKSLEQVVLHNGYVGDMPLATFAHGIVRGNISYDYGDSYYSGSMAAGATYTVNHTLSLPEGANVKLARLYTYWTWSNADTPVMSLNFAGNTVMPEATYSDRKDWGSYDYPSGTWACNVTGLVPGNGEYRTIITNTNPDTSRSFIINGVCLLVVYEEPEGEETEYWINEGADMLSTTGSSGGMTSEEATTEALFSGTVDLDQVGSAELWTVVPSGKNEGNFLLFNEAIFSGIYEGSPSSSLDIDRLEAVEDCLKEENNAIEISAAPSEIGGDFLVPSGAILLVRYGNDSSGGNDSSSISIGVEILPAISLSVTPNEIYFGTLSPGETSRAETITLQNNGKYALDVTADVTDSADNLFMDGILLDSAPWASFSKTIASKKSSNSNVALRVPSDYAGTGNFEGNLTFWAEIAA
ncbi:DUF3344 domain-containing protein [Methanosarcina sp. KYL-1]|uniref:DUF3344 domain-containing protein n=1 Tax=Methanosarcina sp. KYL-1 TaxID=2602068 RepID=UPI00210187F8|nr:DUF3344 domain-containing protein [Methanosarcina sp. KYL-1]MCQ1535811.1 DUF3344 domain-containing protein [Methanosarcina sp. KYL-1]